MKAPKILVLRAAGTNCELETAGAYRVYDDPQDLLEHIDELGIRTHV